MEDTTQPVITGPNAATSAGTGADGTTIEAGITAVTSFSADEDVTWKLAGADAALFEITTSGALTLKDPGVVGTYLVEITGTDAAGNLSILTFTLTVEDTTKPVITGPNAATSAGTGADGTTIEAGTTAVTSFSADEDVTWKLAGADAALFEISTSGALTLKDPGVVGTYLVEITGTDAAGNVSVLSFTLTVERATYIEAEADKSTGIANSADAVEITVTLTDENNLPVVGKAVELTTDFGILFINPSGTTVLTRDNGDGTYTAFLRSDEPGEATITVTIDGVDQPNQLSVEFILIDETGSALSASPSEIRANGSDTSQITVSLYDAEGSLLPAGGDTVVLASTLGILSAVMDNGNGTYSATLTAGTEVGVATVSGTVNGIAIAAPTTVRFAEYQQAVRDAFTDVTSAFIHRRMDRILSAEPRSHHLDRRREATSGPQFSLEYQRNSGELASRLQLAGTLGDMPRGGLDITASEASPSSFLRFSGNVGSTDRSWYFWTEGQYSAYQDATGTIAQRDGGFGIVFLGVDYLVNERLSFGVMAHADRASERIDSYSEVSGDGWMVGPYISAELTEDLFFSGRVAWGESRNSASIDVFSDNTQWRGNFGTERFLARGALYGSYELGRARLRPQVDLAYMRENQDDYVVSDGVSEVSVAGIEAEIGRLTFSTEIEWPVETIIGAMSAFVIPKLDWDFHTSAPNGQHSQTRGSLEFGLRTVPNAGWSGEAAVRYDGIGQSGFNAWNLRLGAQIDF
ncbi:MAG: autotransporter domain-containing protein [Loktanella sp.]|nr:autotransporter domain-containing protein [Loktanella sp.]